MDIPLKVRMEVFNRAGGLCEGIVNGQRCLSPGDWRGLSMHHIKKRSQGGQHTADNLRLQCGKCHSLDHGIKEV